METNIACSHCQSGDMTNHTSYLRDFAVLTEVLFWERYLISLEKAKKSKVKTLNSKRKQKMKY